MLACGTSDLNCCESRRWPALKCLQPVGVSDTVTRLRLSQFAFPRNALMLFICTFNAIFELAPIVGELLGHFVNPAWHIATDCGPEDHALTDMEFMRHHGAPSR